jgi:hypothetical protein
MKIIKNDNDKQSLFNSVKTSDLVNLTIDDSKNKETGMMELKASNANGDVVSNLTYSENPIITYTSKGKNLEDYIYIEWMETNKDMQGNGYATELVKNLKDKYPNKIILADANDNSSKLLTKLGITLIVDGELFINDVSRIKELKDEGFDLEGIWFHGSDKDFDEFDFSKIGNNYDSHYGEGAYFASMFMHASEHGNVKNYKLDIKNPMKWSLSKVKDARDKGMELSEYAKSLGHDGILVGDRHNAQIVAFNNKQIKRLPMDDININTVDSSDLNGEHSKIDKQAIKKIKKQKGILMEDIKVDKTYYDSGQLKYKEEIKNDLRHGVYEKYYPSGQLCYQVNYKEGQLHGDDHWYYESGQLREKKSYENNKSHGTFEYYNTNGKLNDVKEYDNGVEVDKDNSLINKTSIKKRKFK